MMPSVTEPPSPNGLPIAITQSPTRMAAEEPNFTDFSGFRRGDLQQRDVGLGVLADELGLELGAVVQVDLDLVGAVDHVVVGDDDAFLAVDDEAGAERGDHAVRRRAAAVVIEEIVEVFMIGRALRHARAAAAPAGP